AADVRVSYSRPTSLLAQGLDMAKLRLTLPVAAIMLGSAQACFYGCSDSTASSQAQAAAKLDTAITTLDASSQGYVPEDLLAPNTPEAEASYARVVDQYQQAKRDEAAAQLADVIANGSPAAKVGALRLRADIQSSKARHLTREAMTAWASLSAESATLL